MKRGRCWCVGLLAVLLSASTAGAQGELVTAADLKAKDEWVQQHLAETKPPVGPQAELQVWACLGGIVRNRRAGRPLVIANREFLRGLIAHAPSKLVVQLDSPGKTFAAVVGVDSNECTRPGLGSVVFSVMVGGKVAAQSPVLREGAAGVPLEVDLGGATSFTLEASDGGDGFSSDHADWADARVLLADGRELWLGDLPEASDGDALPFSFVYDGTPSKWLLPRWPRKDATQALDPNRRQRTTTWTDPKTSLEVRCTSVEYLDFPVVGWNVGFWKGGKGATPILHDNRA